MLNPDTCHVSVHWKVEIIRRSNEYSRVSAVVFAHNYGPCLTMVVCTDKGTN